MTCVLQPKVRPCPLTTSTSFRMLLSAHPFRPAFTQILLDILIKRVEAETNQVRQVSSCLLLSSAAGTHLFLLLCRSVLRL